MPVPWLLKFWHDAGRSCIDKYIVACPPCRICHWFWSCWPGWFDDRHNSGCRRRGWFFERAIWRNDFRIVHWLCPNFLFLWLPEFLPIRSWPPFDHYCAVVLQNVEKACCDNQQQAFSCFGGKCAEPTNFTFQRRSIPPCRSSPTTATGQVFGLLLCDTALFASAKTQWSTVVRPRIDHYWKLTTLQDWNTL